MRDFLNLQALKHSRSKKHNTIYEKAHRIIEQGWETEELSDEQIMEIANRYSQLNIRLIVGGDIIVRSKKDTWLIKDEVRFLSLYHKGIVFRKGKVKEQYHIQDVFYDLEFIFASIISHDDYVLGIKSRNTDDILEMVQQSQ